MLDVRNAGRAGGRATGRATSSDAARAVVHKAERATSPDADDWQTIALGNRQTDGRATVQIRLAGGPLLTGTYVRSGADLDLRMKPLRKAGQPAAEYASAKADTFALHYSRHGKERLELTGDRSLTLHRDHQSTVLYDRGFSWGMRTDDPFER